MIKVETGFKLILPQQEVHLTREEAQRLADDLNKALGNGGITIVTSQWPAFSEGIESYVSGTGIHTEITSSGG